MASESEPRVFMEIQIRSWNGFHRREKHIRDGTSCKHEPAVTRETISRKTLHGSEIQALRRLSRLLQGAAKRVDELQLGRSKHPQTPVTPTLTHREIPVRFP